MSSPALHLRAPLLWLLLPLIAGFACAQCWPLPAGGPRPLLVLGLALAASALAGGVWNHPWLWRASLAAATALGGFLYLHQRYPFLHEWSRRPPREVTVLIEVQRTFPPAPGARSLQGLAVISRANADPEWRGRRVSYAVIRRLGPAPRRDGAYLVRGVIEALAPDGEGFDDYLAKAGIRHRLTRARVVAEAKAPGRFPQFCTAAEQRLQEILGRGLEDRPASRSLYLAMLLGERAVLSADQQNAFMRSGTFHIFSISGLHVMIIATALQGLLSCLRVPRRKAVLVALPVLWLYVQVTGGNAPATRAFLMVAFLLGAKVFRLPGNPLAALTASALLTLLLDPLQLFSAGFQMSYVVVVAIVLMGRPLGERWLTGWKPFGLLPPTSWRWRHHLMDALGRRLIGSLAICWTAFVASAPAGIGFFGLLSPGALLANLLVIPLSTCAINAGFASLLTGLAGLAFVSTWLNQGAAVVIDAMDFLLQHGAPLPGIAYAAQFRAPWLGPAALAILTAALFAGANGHWSRRTGGYWLPVIVLGLLVIFGVKFGAGPQSSSP